MNRACLPAVVFPAIAALCLLRRRVAVVTVVGESMLPTFVGGDRILVRRAGVGDLRPGQVVVIEKPGPGGRWDSPPARWAAKRQEWMIKRVAAVPGAARPVPWPSTAGSTARAPDPATETVPPGRFAVLGDNPDRSLDSRQLGYVPADRLLGIALRRLPAS